MCAVTEQVVRSANSPVRSPNRQFGQTTVLCGNRTGGSVSEQPCADRTTSVVLVWLHIIRFSFSKKANEERSLILVIVSQLKRKKGY